MTNRYTSDNRIVLTLDAGGTNFVFSAIQGNKEIIEPITSSSNAHDIDLCVKTIIEGFRNVLSNLNQKPVAISFAFPGPANYGIGIIGDLPNLPAFRGGVPLGPILENEFGIPVFINNDGDLFAYGEALMGFLPSLNQKLETSGKGVIKYNNLIGITLGTGFGCGIVLKNKLLTGDNSCGAEIHNLTNPFNRLWNAEESVSTRAILRIYCELARINCPEWLMPKDIYAIAKGQTEGNKDAAITAFAAFGEALGNSIINVLTIIDGIVVIGGGLSGAWDLFAPAMFREINRQNKKIDESTYHRLSYRVYNLEDDSVFDEFSQGNVKIIDVPGTNKKFTYDNCPRTGIGLSKLGASIAIALGAYTYALNQLDSYESN